MAAKVNLDAVVLDVLSRSTTVGNLLTLPQQLDRATYVQVDKALKAMGGKWDRGAGGHVFPFDPSELLAQGVEDGAVVDRKKELQFFETPSALAARMVGIARAGRGDRALEPSAGHGRIVEALVAAQVDVVAAVEIDATNAAVLRAAFPGTGSVFAPTQVIVYEEDFLRADAFRGLFDVVVMNPPFARFADTVHVRAAYKRLAPGGRLVAVCSESPFFRQARVAVEFRDWLDEVGAEVEVLPEGTFAGSGTGVNARLVSVERGGW